MVRKVGHAAAGKCMQAARLGTLGKVGHAAACRRMRAAHPQVSVLEGAHIHR